MMDLSLPNVITIAVISVAAVALTTFACKAMGVSLPGFNDGM